VSGLVLLASAASAQVSTWPSETPPEPLPARRVPFPPYEIRTLPNGMQVVAVLHHEQPVVTMRLLVRAGAAQDPANKSGLAYLTAHLLDQGTATRSAQQIAQLIDDIGGAMATGSGADLSFANVMVMKDSFETGMQLLADVVHHPSFAPEEIERQKTQVISSLRVNAEDPDSIASEVFDRLVFGVHPYGNPQAGTPTTLSALTRDDLLTFHRQYYVPNNMILAVVGDVTGDEAFSMAEKAFSAWERGPVPAQAATDVPRPRRRLVIIDKPDAVQTEIRVGQLAMPRRNPDWLAWDLAVRILGGEGANRLHRILRSERGLTYGASAAADGMMEAGDVMAQTDTRTETTAEALRLVVDEFARLQRQRVQARELGGAEEYLAGSFPLTIETPNDIATQVLNTVFYDLPVDDLGTFRERVISVSPDDIQRVAQKYIKPDGLSIVLVGNARGFVRQLVSVGFTDYEVIAIDQLDLMSPSLKRAPAQAAAPRQDQASHKEAPHIGSALHAESASVGRPFAGRLIPVAYTPNQADARGAVADQDEAHALLMRVIAAKGGLASLKNVRTVVADADTTLQMPQGSVSSSTKTYIVYPDRYRVDANVGGAEIVQVYNSGGAWVKDPTGVHDAPPAMRDDFAASVRRDTFPLLIGAAEGRLSVRLLADARADDGRDVHVLEISGPDVTTVTLYIDSEDLIARQAFTSPGPTGAQVTNEEVFSDYRDVDGVRIPFNAQLLRDGTPVLTRRLTRVQLNTQLSDSLFARPN
jgi:zinc protease